MSAPAPIYLDNHSTTRVDPRVLEVMLPYFTEHYGNAASKAHAYGWRAEAAVDQAREHIANLIGGKAAEIVFTSGATEADNLALKGVAAAYRKRGDHLVTLTTEHKAVLDSARALEAAGARVTYLRPGRDGLIGAEQVVAAMEPGTVLVSVMHAQNEIGVVQPIEAIARAVKAHDARCLVHTDAAQSAGKVPLAVEAAGVDLCALSAHKLYGPQGVGALWVRRRPRVTLAAQTHGGGHEWGLRSGTLPVALVVGFGEAARLAALEMAAEAERVRGLRERLLAGITVRLTGVHVNGALEPRLPGNLNLSFAGVDGEALLLALAPQLAVSSGAACSSATAEPSYVLRAIGVDERLAHASIRFGLGRYTTGDEVAQAIGVVVEAVERLRALGAN